MTQKNALTLPSHAAYELLFPRHSFTNCPNYLSANFAITLLSCAGLITILARLSPARVTLIYMGFSGFVTPNHVNITCGISSSSISWLSDHLNGFSPYTWPPFVFSESNNTRAQYSRFTAGLFPPNSAGRISRWQWSWSVVKLLPCTCI